MHPTSLHANFFRAWVDQAALDFSRLPTDLESLYREFSLVGQQGLSRATLASHLREKAYRSLVMPQGLDPDKLDLLSNHLYLQHLVEGEALQPYLDTLETIQMPIPFASHRKGQKIAPMDEGERWQRAAYYAYAAHQLHPVGGLPDDAREKAFRRQHQAAESAKFLRVRGYEPKVDGGRVRFYGQYEQIANEISALIRRVGGYELLIALCRAHQPLLDRSAGRYQVGRHVGGVGADIPPQLPWAFLQNLAAKYCHMARVDESVSDDVLEEIAQLATALVATFEVQPYHQLDGVVLSAETLEDEMEEILLYDAAFLPTQVCPRVAVLMIKVLFRWADDQKLELARGWTLSSAVAVCETLLGGGLGVPLSFTRSALLANLPAIPLSHIDKLLSILTHESGTVNADYCLPGDAENLSDRPLLKRPDGTYILIDPSLCALAFYEALARDLRAFDKKQGQEKIGNHAEILVREQLLQRGLIVHHGEYTDSNGDEGECDVVIETTRSVIFMELKAKPLTRVAKSGVRVKLFDDLAKSLLHAQLQAHLHEARLRRDGFLDLETSDGKSYRVELHNREVQKFAITLFEFGALQDQLFVRSFLDIAVRAAVTSDDAGMDDFRSKHAELVGAYTGLLNEHPELQRRGFTNTWFLSIAMVLSMLEHVQSGNDFDNICEKVGKVSFRTRNFFSELAFAQMP